MKQEPLFPLPETPDPWAEHWRGMPEFVTEKTREFAKIIIRFRTQEDLDDFARLIGQKLNKNSQCTWHPELPPPDRLNKLVYVDDDES